MKKNNLTLKIFLLIFFVNIFYGQEVKILKESIKIENNDLELQELQLCKQDDFIYKKIQTTYNLFNGEYFTIPKQRLKAKKDLIEKSIKNNDLKESQIGFEKYDIYFILGVTFLIFSSYRCIIKIAELIATYCIYY